MIGVGRIREQIRRLFWPSEQQIAANKLYNALVGQARLPAFYEDAEVPDTLDGRFDMIVLHAFLVMHRLKDQGTRAEEISQVLFDEMFLDMDRSLREMGVGDMGVGRRVRAMGKAFMGRIEAYDNALTEDGDALAEALSRNIYRSAEEVPEGAPKRLADYTRAQVAHLMQQPLELIVDGEVEFAAPFVGQTV